MKLIKNIILIGVLILGSGVAYHFLSLKQEGRDFDATEVGVGTRQTVDEVKDVWSVAKEKGDSLWVEVKEGYNKKDSI